jgi:hypothetical protein
MAAAKDVGRLMKQYARWDRRLRIVLDWTVALFFRHDITKVGLQVERQLTEQMLRSSFSKNRAPTV